MSKLLVVSIPHRLGKAEAMRRLQGGLGSVKHQFGDKIASIEENWTDDRMAFRVGALGQSIDGHLDVMEDQVLVEVKLPWICDGGREGEAFYPKAGHPAPREEISLFRLAV